MTDRPIPLAFDLLLTSRDEIRVALATIERARDAGDRDRDRTALATQIRIHMQMKDEALYPQLARVPAGAPVVERMRQSARDVEIHRQALDGADPTTGHFPGATRGLAAALEAHFESEDRELLPAAAAELAGELEMIAVEMEAARSRAIGAYGVG